MPLYVAVTIINQTSYPLYLRAPDPNVNTGYVWRGNIPLPQVIQPFDDCEAGVQSHPGARVVRVWQLYDIYLGQNPVMALLVGFDADEERMTPDVRSARRAGAPGVNCRVGSTFSYAQGTGYLTVNLLPLIADGVFAEPVAAAPEPLTPANAVGQGFDIYGVYSVVDQVLPPLFDAEKAATSTFKFRGVEYTIPAFVDAVENTDTRIDSEVCETRDAYQNALAVSVGVSARYGAFSGEMSASFSRQFTQNSQYDYAYQFFNARYARLKWADSGSWPYSYLTDDFRSAIEGLPADTTDLTPFAEFFEHFGTYFVSALNLGACLQYCSAVAKSSQLDTVTIKSMVKAEYTALFTSVGMSTSITDTSEWQSYSQSRDVTIRATGGDPGFASQLSSASPDSASTSGSIPSAFTSWVTSAAESPAIVDFQLAGVWTLCGSKAPVVEKAFELYGQSMRPTMTIELSTGPFKTPIIMLDGQIKPDYPPDFSAGYQVVVFDRKNVSAAGVLYNEYYSFDPTLTYDARFDAYFYLYESLMEDLKGLGFDTPNYFVVLASFGLPDNAGPPRSVAIRPNLDAYAFFRELGGSSNLELWAQSSDPGSQFLESCIYALVGIPGYGFASGVDLYETGEESAKLEVIFYREKRKQSFTLGLNSPASVKSGRQQVELLREKTIAAMKRRAIERK